MDSASPPKVIIRLNNLKKLFKNILKVTSLIVLTCSLDTSIIIVPIKGKMKKIIPKIGVTWCDVTVTEIKDSDVNK